MLAGLLASMTLQAASPGDRTFAYAESLERLDIRRSQSRVRDAAASREPVTMRFDALGRSFDLDLRPNTALLSPAARASLEPEIAVLRGGIVGNDESWARIVIRDGVPSGMIFDGSEMLAIEAAADPAAPDAGPVIFRLADLNIEPNTMSCAAGTASTNGQLMYRAMVSELKTSLQRTARADGAVEELEIGVLADADYRPGNSDREQTIINRLNNVDGIYSSELGIQITVPANGIEIFDDSNDPFSNTTDTDDLIDELADYRRNSPTQRQFGLTHLYTGRNLDGSTVGIAYIDVLCNTNFGVGLSEGRRNLTIDSLIAAHEIGHNFGADHDGEAGGTCPNAPDDMFIMGPSVNGSQTFSGCSKSIMSQNASSASCIAPLPTVDMSASAPNDPADVLLGNAINLTFELDNRGSVQAENVNVDISLPDNVSFVAATATQGTCTSGASTVSCAIGGVPGNTGVSVTLTANTIAAGDAAFAATVSADDDAAAGNNTDTHVVDIIPAVNLGMVTPLAAEATVAESGNARVVIANAALLDATGVTVGITLDAGLEATAASWTAGNCVVTAQQVDCSGGAVGASSSSTLVLDITGLTVGAQSYTVTVASSEADSDDADNVVSGSFTVNEAPPPPGNGGGGNGGNGGNGGSGGDGGGGSPGPALLALLGVLLLRRGSKRVLASRV